MDKKTPFYSIHKSLNAKLVPFAGYLMPIQYKGVIFEHNHVREKLGVFDVSHMSQIMIEGDNAGVFLQRITTNDIFKLKDGKVQYSCMLNEDGGIIDDLLVYRINSTLYMLVVNASNAMKDFDWINSKNDFNLSILDVTPKRGLLALQGPKSKDLLQKLTSIDLNHIPYYSFKIAKLAGCDDVIISNTGYTGSGGFELYMKHTDALNIWESLFQNSNLLEPIGLAARDTLRLEMGYCLYGNDITENTSPIEAQLAWIVKLTKEFIGKKVIEKQLSEGVSKVLIGFILEERGIPRKDYDILNIKEEIIGKVTSGTMSPSLNKAIGMGYVNIEESGLETTIFILIRDKKVRARIVKRPFYEK